MKSRRDTRRIEIPEEEKYFVPDNDTNYYSSDEEFYDRSNAEIPEIDIPEEELLRMEMPAAQGDEPEEPQRSKKKKRKKKHYFLKFLFIVALLCGIFFFMNSAIFDIQSVDTVGNHRYTKAQLMKKADINIGDNVFFMSASKREDALLSDPFIAKAEIKRVLPKAIKITVKERVVAGAVKSGKEYVVIDSEGTVLKKMDTVPKTTVLTGLTPTKSEPGKPLEIKEDAYLQETLDMLTSMQKSELFFKKIDISKVTVRAYITNTLYCKGEPKNILKTMNEGKLDKVIYELKKSGQTRGVVIIGDNDYCSFSPDLGD